MKLQTKGYTRTGLSSVEIAYRVFMGLLILGVVFCLIMAALALFNVIGSPDEPKEEPPPPPPSPYAWHLLEEPKRVYWACTPFGDRLYGYDGSAIAVIPKGCP